MGDYPVYDFNPKNLPAEYLEAIGLVVASAAQTESFVGMFIGATLNIDSLEAIALTAHMSAPLKDTIARSLIEMNAANSQVIDDVDDLLDAINDAQDRRNRIVHNAFVVGDDGQVYSHRESARGSLQISLKPITVEQIREDAAVIYKVGLDLWTFMSERQCVPADRTRPRNLPMNRRKKARELRKRAD